MSEYLNDDDRVLALRTWWEANGTALVVGLVLMVGAVIGWRWYTDYAQARYETASATYQRYLESRQRDAKADEQDPLLATLDNDFRGSGYRIFTLFYRAFDATEAADYPKATGFLETAVKDADDAGLRDIARLRLARLQVQSGDPDGALETLRKVAATGFRAYVAELKGDILVGQGKQAEALVAYQAAAAAAPDPGEPQPVLDMKIVDLATPNAPAP